MKLRKKMRIIEIYLYKNGSSVFLPDIQTP